jgi:hypothetical protein
LIETHSRQYLPGSSTSAIRLGYNGLTTDWNFIFGSWPFAKYVFQFLDWALDGSALKWAWQIVSISAFTIFGVVGFLTIASLVLYLYRNASSWTEFRPFTLLVLVMAVGSLVIGLVVAAGNDSYSVAGETLFMPAWYLFPLVAVTAKKAYTFIQTRLRLSSSTWLVVGMLIVMIGSWIRWVGPVSIAVNYEYKIRMVQGDQLRVDRWDAIQWLRQHTPRDAVVISKTYSSGQIYFSGLAGRAGYFEWSSVVHDPEDQRTFVQDRTRLVQELWASSQASEACSLLKKTPATYLVEFSTEPLAITAAPCLSLAWTSPYEEARIWNVINH